MLILFLFLFANQFALATQIHPEFFTIHEEDVLEIENSRKIDGEYESDVMTYSPQFSDLVLYHSSPKAFIGSFGSLDGKFFYVRQALKAEFPVTETLSFKVVQFREQDFELDQSDIIFEFSYRLGRSRNSLAVYGSAASAKKDDDVGVAYIWSDSQAEKSRYFRLYLLAADYSRNERNTATDRFEKEPFVYGLLYRSTTTSDFFETSLNYQSPVRWSFPDEQLIYRAERLDFQQLVRKSQPHHFFNAKLQLTSAEEGKRPDDLSSPVVTEEVKREKIRTQLEYEKKTARSEKLGLWLASRSWRGTDEANRIFVQPYFSRKLSRSSTSFWEGGLSAVSSHHDESRIDSRLNLSYNYLLKDRLSLRAFFTFDIDRIKHSDRWEGGNLQLTAHF